MHPMSAAREIAMKYLYMMDVYPDCEPLEEFLDVEAEDEPEKVRVRKLVGSVIGREQSLDERIEAATNNWRVSRIGRVERVLLRLGLAEIESGQSRKIAINEMVNLSRIYGSKESPKFVNGVLDRASKETQDGK